MQIADKFYNAFIEDMDALNIVTISRFERVSNYIEESAASSEAVARLGECVYS